MGRPAWRKAREVIQSLLESETPTLRDDKALRARVFHARKDVTMHLPCPQFPHATRMEMMGATSIRTSLTPKCHSFPFCTERGTLFSRRCPAVGPHQF